MYEIEINNKIYTVKELACEYKLSRTEVYKLLSIYSEKKILKALEKASRRGKYEYNGKVYSLDELVKMSLVDKNTLKQRIFRGWTVMDAVQKPYFYKRK